MKPSKRTKTQRKAASARTKARTKQARIDVAGEQTRVRGFVRDLGSRKQAKRDSK